MNRHLKALTYLKWGHLGSLFVIIASMLLKKYGKRNIGQHILVFLIPLTYGGPITYCAFTFKMTEAMIEFDLNTEGIKPSYNETILVVEAICFFAWLSAIPFAMCWFKSKKYKSIYNADYDDSLVTSATTSQGEVYFWKRKDSDDFLKYVKREIFEIGYFLCCFLMSIKLI